jgi:hypothetical protein
VGGGLRVSRRARRSHTRFYLGPGPRGRRPARAQACRRGRRRCGGERTDALTVNCQRLPGSSTAAGDGLGRAPRCDRGATSASAATRQRSVLGPRRHRTRTGLRAPLRAPGRAGCGRVPFPRSCWAQSGIPDASIAEVCPRASSGPGTRALFRQRIP